MEFNPFVLNTGDVLQCVHCKLNNKIEKIGPRHGQLNGLNERVLISPLITNGVESESYLIKNFSIINKGHIKPRLEAIEPGEIFTNDETIGNEYNSVVFDDINEGLFLLKYGLRKYRTFCVRRADYQIGLFGTWLGYPAGAHIHIGFDREEGIKKKEALPLMRYLHDYLPMILAICSNSPIFPSNPEKGPEITHLASNRISLYGEAQCKIRNKKDMRQYRFDHWTEIDYNDYRREKPPTIEIRIADSNLPEFVIAAVIIIRVLAIAYLKGKASPNRLIDKNYIVSRENAARDGVNCTLYWNNKEISFSEYIDLFFDYFSEEIEMEAPNNFILDIFRLAKLGWNNANITRESIKETKVTYSNKKYDWKKQFLKKYCKALSSLLDGNSLQEFVNMLNIELPSIKKVKLGKINPI